MKDQHQPLSAYELESWVCVVLTERSFNTPRGKPGYALLERAEAEQLRDSLNLLLDNDVDDLV